jgi:uracil-DNA glycosylase
MIKQAKQQLHTILKKDLWELLHHQLESVNMELVHAKIGQDIGNGKEVYPSPYQLFRAYRYMEPQDVKVVILGQDPYPKGEAIGLAFGVDTPKIPASLRNIYKELCNQFNHVPEEFDYSLEHWAKQGVLLLNTSLTVREGSPGSHDGLWDFLIKDTLRVINQEAPRAIHLLWGKHAKSYKQYINGAVLEAAHPAAEGYRGNAGFYGCGHFYEVNERLKSLGLDTIDWFGDKLSMTETEMLAEYDKE